MYIYKYVDQNVRLAMLAIKRSAGVAPEMNLGNPLRTGDNAWNQETHSGFETQGRHHQKSKNRGISGPTKKN